MREIVVSGIRATGKLHLGNYLGAIKNFGELQKEHRCFFFVADYHTLTTLPDPKEIKDYLLDIVLMFLATGIDPDESTIFAQSSVPEIPELSLLLSMVESVKELERLPTYKEKVKQLKDKKGESPNLGLLSYPVLMAADILVQKATLVPVGKDQMPHINITRRIAGRFNDRYGETFPLPRASQERTKVPGLDGLEPDGTPKKMGKSEDNTINLDDLPEVIRQKIAVAVTDTRRKRRNDKGNPFECNLYALHELVSPEGLVREIKEECMSAGIGCLECKSRVSENIIAVVEPIRQRYLQLAAKAPYYAREVLHKGGLKAREIARLTVSEVREKMGLQQF